jgi:rubredoxin
MNISITRPISNAIEWMKKKGDKMDRYRCIPCGYIYDPEKGDPVGDIEPGVPFDELPDDWFCPICGAPKDEFENVE